jgi:hypothetical protein
VASTATQASAVATSCGVAANVAGISNGWLVMAAFPVGLEPFVDDALMRCVHVDMTRPWLFSAST